MRATKQEFNLYLQSVIRLRIAIQKATEAINTPDRPLNDAHSAGLFQNLDKHSSNLVKHEGQDTPC